MQNYMKCQKLAFAMYLVINTTGSSGMQFTLVQHPHVCVVASTFVNSEQYSVCIVASAK